MECPICSNSEASIRLDAISDEYVGSCPQCGKLQIDRDVADDIASHQAEKGWKILA